jgi:hypothetical protein
MLANSSPTQARYRYIDVPECKCTCKWKAGPGLPCLFALKFRTSEARGGCNFVMPLGSLSAYAL